VALLLDEALDFPFLADHILDDCWSEGVRRLAHVLYSKCEELLKWLKEKVAQVEAVMISPRISAIINTLFLNSKC
jgi:hypothetical protein